MIMAIVPVVLSWIRISDSHRKMDSCALPGISSGSIHIIMCLRTRRKMKMKLKKAMLLFAAAAVAAGTVAGCSGSAKETTAASVAETNAE